jgi:hypothetical protein
MTTFNQWLLRWLNGASLLMVVLVMVVTLAMVPVTAVQVVAIK